METGRAEAAARREEVCRGGQKKLWRKSESWEAVPPASGERLPKVAAGENRKCRAPQVFGEAPVTPSIVSQDK